MPSRVPRSTGSFRWVIRVTRSTGVGAAGGYPLCVVSAYPSPGAVADIRGAMLGAKLSVALDAGLELARAIEHPPELEDGAIFHPARVKQ